MALPVRQLPTEEFAFSDGVQITIRGLSRAEAIQLQGLGSDVTSIEILCISAATRVSKEEASAWLEATPQKDVADLVDAIARLSGLDGEAGKEGAEGSHSAKSTG